MQTPSDAIYLARLQLNSGFEYLDNELWAAACGHVYFVACIWFRGPEFIAYRRLALCTSSFSFEAIANVFA